MARTAHKWHQPIVLAGRIVTGGYGVGVFGWQVLAKEPNRALLLSALALLGALVIAQFWELYGLRHKPTHRVTATGSGLPRWRLTVSPHRSADAPQPKLLVFIGCEIESVVQDVKCRIENPAGTSHEIQLADIPRMKTLVSQPTFRGDAGVEYPGDFPTAPALEPGNYAVAWYGKTHGHVVPSLLASGTYNVEETFLSEL